MVTMRRVSDLQFVRPVYAFVLPLPPKEQATDLQYELKCYFLLGVDFIFSNYICGSFKMIQFKI